MTVEEIFKPIIREAASRAAEEAVRRYIEKTATSSPRSGERYDVKVAMKRTGWSRQTIYQRHSNGTIPGAVKVGSKLMFDAAILEDWIAAGCPPVNA